MKQYETRLRARSDQGVFWWELRSCAYYSVYESPKIVWQDLSYHSRFCLCPGGIIPEATCFALRRTDMWLVAALNSPLLWCWMWRNTIHGKDEVLRLKNIYTEKIPIAKATDHIRHEAETAVVRLIEIANCGRETRREILDWLRVEHEIEKPTLKLQAPLNLDSNALIAEVKKVRGKKKPLTAAALKSLRDEYASTIEPARKLAAEALALEHQVSDLVNEAYGLTPAEIRLLWDTAPPRMPIPRPVGS